MPEEKRLVGAAKLGDKSAFEELVRLYEKKIYNMGLRYTGSEQDALDVCQEVFLRIYRFIPQFNEASSFSTWCYRIAVNVCKDVVGRRRSYMETSFDMYDDEDEAYELEVADMRFDPADAAERKELVEAIRQGIRMLGHDHRQIVIMRDINGMTYEEISRCLNIEEGTVKSRLARAREKLRVFLCETGNFYASKQSKELERGSR